MNKLQRRAHALRKSGQLDAAAAELSKGVAAAAAALADLHGARGGTYREQGRMRDAIREYDIGYALESRYRIRSTYNALNRLLTRLMARGQSRASAPRAGRSRAAVDVDDSLREVRGRLAQRLDAEGSTDFWAAGDMALVAALLRDARKMKSAIALFAGPSTPPFAYEAYLRTVSQLLDAAPAQSRHLRTLQRELRRRAGRRTSG